MSENAIRLSVTPSCDSSERLSRIAARAADSADEVAGILLTQAIESANRAPDETVALLDRIPGSQ